MPYCPECLTEYVEGTRQCEDCGGQLVPGSPPVRTPEASVLDESNDVKMVTVRMFSGPTAVLDAGLARTLLQNQGIPCFLSGETSAELLPGLEVPLLVREQDAGRASRVLRDYFDSPGPISVL